MAVDILDAIAHPTGFEEFIILASDADFTPVLLVAGASTTGAPPWSTIR